MSSGKWLLLVTCTLGLFGVGQIWLVQLSSYWLWPYVGEREFAAYHLAWWHSVWGVVFVPWGLNIICAVLMLWWRAPAVPVWAPWLGVALQVVLVLGTALWWGPLMARLQTGSGGLSLERYELLMSTHWLRVSIVTAYGLLVLLMLAKSAWKA